MNRPHRVASSLFLSFWAILALGALHEACAGNASTHPAPDAAARDGASDAGPHDARGESDAPRPPDAPPEAALDAAGDDAAAGPSLVALRVAEADAGTTLPLVPAFAPDVHDYYVRCSGAANALVVSMTAAPGSESALSAPTKSASAPKQTVPVDVKASEAIVATATRSGSTIEYWVRCLPPDFPDIEMTTYPDAGTPPAPGYYLLGSFVALGAAGGYAMALNGDGVPVWYHPESLGGVCDVDAIAKGEIAYFPIGVSTMGGPARVITLSPFVVSSLAPAGAPTDIHEIVALANGDDLMISSPNEGGVDLTGLPFPLPDGGAWGKNSTIVDCNLVEFDPKTGKVVWTWKATDHFDPVKDTENPIPGPGLEAGGYAMDTFHCNAVDVDPANGNLLVSARQMDSIFYVEKATGRVLWKLGGAAYSKDATIIVPLSDPFYGQHDARLQPGWSTCGGGRISLFDDETYGKGPARAMLYDVTVTTAPDGGCDAGAPASATATWQLLGASQSSAAGSLRVAADGTRLIGWGFQPTFVFTEVDAKGNVLRRLVSNDLGSVFPMQSYRVIKVPPTELDLTAMRRTAGRP